eukprot:4771602-Amphidinium_carterae.2
MVLHERLLPTKEASSGHLAEEDPTDQKSGHLAEAPQACVHDRPLEALLLDSNLGFWWPRTSPLIFPTAYKLMWCQSQLMWFQSPSHSHQQLLQLIKQVYPDMQAPLDLDATLSEDDVPLGQLFGLPEGVVKARAKATAKARGLH